MSFPTKDTRQKCWDARDRYWTCLDENNEEGSKCLKMRQDYESHCPAQWIKHFDRKRDYLKFKEKIEQEGECTILSNLGTWDFDLPVNFDHMKIWTSEHIFNHPWEKVVEAAWRKYPNPMNPAVIGIDVVDRKVSNGVLVSKRLITSQWGLPSWAQSILGPTNIFYAKEFSSVDPTEKVMKLRTHNLTCGSILAIDETLSYEQYPNDPEKTRLKQEAVVTVKGIPLSSYFEGILTSNISHNANKGRQAIEWVIEKIETEVEDLKNSAIKSLDEITLNAKKSMDDLSSVAKKSFSDFNLGNVPSSKKGP